MAKNEKEIKAKKQKGHYFKDMKAELKKVIWPTPKQTVNNTIAVIVFTLVIAIIVFVLDLCFDSITKYGITPLQEKIQSSYNSTKNETENTNQAEESNTTGNETNNNETKVEENDNSTEVNVKTESNSTNTNKDNE